MTSTDVESLKPRCPSRSRCLDTCLLASVITLFVMVLGGGLAAWILMKNLNGDVNGQKYLARLDGHPTLVSELQNYKGQNFAFLRATSEMNNGVLTWESVRYGQGQTVGLRYSYDSSHHALTVLQEGSYFIYTQLRFTCVHWCHSTNLTVTFTDQHGTQHLSCYMELPEGLGPVNRKCWTVIPQLNKKSRLLARAEVKSSMNNWRLDMNESGFGMFSVDGPLWAE